MDQPAQGSAHRILTLHGAHNLIKDEVFVKRLAMSQEVLGCALSLLTASAIPRTGPVWGSGLLPRVPPPTCSRPVSDVGLGPSYYTASLLWSTGPRPSPVFRSAICDCLSLNVSILFVIKRICISHLSHAHSVDFSPFINLQEARIFNHPGRKQQDALDGNKALVVQRM